ncbi:MAG: class I SAM-dependent RNA methyltransferase [Firmicutes bacterium]|nr:class I SAM-dependent RNA methyltransferase [Bacillota bacterium]
MNDGSLRLTVPTLFGLESVVAAEIKRLGLPDVSAEDGRVHCRGNLTDIARLNVSLRSGERVLLELGSFPARDFDALFEGVRALPWEDFIPREGAFPVKGYCLNSTLHSEPACQSVIKKAAAERLAAAYGLQELPESGALYQIQFSLFRDRAALLLDTTGPALYKRGYRQSSVLAPLRETLAAGLVQLMRWRGREPFRDPHCGSGTICIEAALIALNRAPGLDRSFAAQKWACLPGEAWSAAAEEALDKEFHGEYRITGSDMDPQALRAARTNAAAAGLEDVISFQKLDSARLTAETGPGVIVTNPPYGQRLLEAEQADALVRSFGAACAGLPAGWRVGVISPQKDFETLFGRKADRRRKLYNGKLACQFYMYS